MEMLNHNQLSGMSDEELEARYVGPKTLAKIKADIEVRRNITDDEYEAEDLPIIWRGQAPGAFARVYDDTPNGFQFSIFWDKGSGRVGHRNTLEEAIEECKFSLPEIKAVYQPIESRPKPLGEFERLMALIESEIANAQGGWSITWNDALQIVQRESTNPSQSNNGGDYYHYINFRPDGFGVEVWESWSCDFANRREYGSLEDRFECIVSLDGLERMAKLATVTVVAKAWLNKEPGCMKKLKAAIKALED